jgi:aromatic ring-cleaving dioxygenase
LVPAPTPQPAARGRLADVAAALDRLEDARRARRAASEARPEETHPTATRAHAPVHRPSLAERREPARHWVQLAHAVDPTVLPYEYTKVKDKAPRLFAGRVAWTMISKSANRLLIGPFDSEEAAQHFVDRLEKADVTGLAWTSEAGQKVEKLTPR